MGAALTCFMLSLGALMYMAYYTLFLHTRDLRFYFTFAVNIHYILSPHFLNKYIIETSKIIHLM